MSPVNVQLLYGQKTAILTVINEGTVETSIQIRAYDWAQPDGVDLLVPSDAILVSPPLVTIAPKATQVIRIVLRHLSDRGENSYRVILDQIPPPGQPGVIQVVLRLSIPVFTLPRNHLLLHTTFHVEQGAKGMFLVAVNDGGLHEALSNIALWSGDGVQLKNEFSGSTYILAGVTRRWPIAVQVPVLNVHGSLRLKAVRNSGLLDQQVPIVEIP